MKQESWFEKHKALGITLIIIGTIVLTSLLIYLFVPNEFSKKPKDSSSGSSYSPAKDTNISAIEPKKQEPLNVIYSEEDAKNAIAEAKGMANNQQQKNSFFGKYTFTSTTDNSQIMELGTPYAGTVINIASKIEKYDPYTLGDALTMINYNIVLGNVYGLVTDKAYYTYLNKDDLRAVIEYDNGKICRGEISGVESELGDMDSNFNYNYLTSIYASFDGCYSEIHNKVVDFVYVLGSEKFKFTDIDMSKLK